MDRELPRRSRRARRPGVEAVEPRALLSGVIAALHPARPGGHLHAEVAAPAVNQFVVPPNSLTPATGAPTAKELARERFRATFIGTYQVGRGRFSNQASTILIQGAGTSTAFLHGDVQVGIVTFNDGVTPAAGQSTSFDRNINSNSVLGLDLTGTGDLDRAGRPTRFTYVIDDNTSAGTYDEATVTGGNVLTIRYLPSSPTQGKAIVAITGNIYALGTTSILGVLSNNNVLSNQKYQL